MYSDTGFQNRIKTEQVVFLGLDKLLFALMNLALRLPPNFRPAERLVSANQVCFTKHAGLHPRWPAETIHQLTQGGFTFSDLPQWHLNLDQTN